MAEMVAATLVTTEIYLAHVIGNDAIEACANALAVPNGLQAHSISARVTLWVRSQGTSVEPPGLWIRIDITPPPGKWVSLTVG